MRLFLVLSAEPSASLIVVDVFTERLSQDELCHIKQALSGWSRS